jgi:hypothetical protein
LPSELGAHVTDKADILSEIANHPNNLNPVATEVPQRYAEPPLPQTAGPESHIFRVFQGTNLWSEGKTQQFVCRPPYINPSLRNNYSLKVTQDIYETTIKGENLVVNSYRIINGNVVITISVRSSDFFKSYGLYEGKWTIEWVKK